MTKKLLSAVLASLTVAGALAAGGCSHEVESPKVTSNTTNPLTPNMVCTDHRIASREVAPIVIEGSGFTPLPTRVLSDEHAMLVLPSVDLKRTGNLITGAATVGDGGAAADGGTGGVAVPTTGLTEVKYSGTPVKVGAPDPDHSRLLSWQSEEKMTIDVDTSVSIRPGVFDVTITNPDKSHKTTIKDGLAAVPPPVVTRIQPPTICVDQTDQKITIYGGFFAEVTDATGAKLEPSITILTSSGAVAKTYSPDPGSMAGCEDAPSQFKLRLCDSMTFTVKTGANGAPPDLAPGDYKLVVTDPTPLDCDSSANDITLTVHAPPKVDTVAPAKICSGGSVVNVTGDNFYPGARAEARCGATVVTSASVTVADPQHATVTFNAGAPAGVTCDFVFINADTCEDRPLPHKTVQGTDGPVLFNVDPFVVYNDMNTSVKLYLTAVSGNFTVKMWPSGGSSTNAITLQAALVPTKTNVIQATIPQGTAVGDYDMQVTDASGCLSIMTKALTVTNNLVVTSGTVEPPFGHSSESVPVTITLASAVTSTGPPRAFLNPATGAGIQLLSVTPAGTTTALPDGGAAGTTQYTAVIPSGVAAGPYKIVMVWPDGQVAVINAPTTDGGVVPVAYTSVTNAPPVIADATPQTVIDNSTPAVTIKGSGFATDATATFICSNDSGVTQVTHVGTVTVAPTAGCGTACTMTATFDATNPGAGSVCVIKVNNVADGTFGSFSAIGVTNSSNNLPAGKSTGRNLNTARRALVSAAVKATSASKFVYAIGGDDGTLPGAMDSMEFAPVSVFGAVSPWVQNAMPNAPKLTTKRSFAGTATIGRYVYVFGGFDGTNPLKSGERALVLSPEEAPVVTDLDLCLAGGTTPCFDPANTGAGLDPGTYSYRVSASIAATDPQNCGGEILASDVMILRLSNINVSGRKAVPKITWDQPRDSNGAALSGVTGYNIYRTPKDGIPGKDEVLLATVSGATTLSFVDDGSKTLGTQKPLPLGSTSAWQPTGSMAVNRQGPAGAAGQHPTVATEAYVYSLGGRDGATGQDSYEYLTVTKLTNGHQTVSATWTAPTTSIGGARWQAAGWSMTNAEANNITVPDDFIYVGTGLNAAGAFINTVSAGKVAAGGDLGTFGTLSAPTNYAGYGYCGLAGQLFIFGGQGFPPSKSVTIQATPPTLAASWNAGISLFTNRYLPGSAVQSATIFFIGGQTAAATATTDTETVLF